MGTWLTVCTQLRTVADAGDEFTRLFACLIPSGTTQRVQDLISLRNGIAHGRATPTTAHSDQLDRLLPIRGPDRRVLRRADIGVATKMTYDGTAFQADSTCFAE